MAAAITTAIRELIETVQNELRHEKKLYSLPGMTITQSSLVNRVRMESKIIIINVYESMSIRLRIA